VHQPGRGAIAREGDHHLQRGREAHRRRALSAPLFRLH
jgi:hypothetical protein